MKSTTTSKNNEIFFSVYIRILNVRSHKSQNFEKAIDIISESSSSFNSILFLERNKSSFTSSSSLHLKLLPSRCFYKVSSDGYLRCEIGRKKAIQRCDFKEKTRSVTFEFDEFGVDLKIKDEIKFRFLEAYFGQLAKIFEIPKFRSDVLRINEIEELNENSNSLSKITSSISGASDNNNNNGENNGSSFIGLSKIPIRMSGRILPKEKEFWEVGLVQWKFCHMVGFFKYLYMQESDTGVIRTVDEFFEEKKLYVGLEKYMRSRRNLHNLKSDISLYMESSQVKSAAECIQNMFYHEDCYKKLNSEIAFVKECMGINMNYYRILRKRVKMIKKEGVSLKEIEDDLKYKNRWMWDPESCRDNLLCYVLFNTSVNDFVEEKFSKFLKFESEYFRKLYDDEDEDFRGTIIQEEIDEGVKIGGYYPSEIDPEEWLNMLNTFNNRNGVHLEKICVGVFVRVYQNEKRLEKKNALKEFVEAQKSIKVKVEEKEELVIEKCAIEERLNEAYCLVDDVDVELIEKLGDEASDIGLKISLLEKDIKNLSDVNPSELKMQFDIAIYQCKIERKNAFYSSNQRRNALDEVFLKEIGKNSGKFKNLKVKLVISKLFKEELTEVDKKDLMSSMDPLVEPTSCSFSLYNSYIKIENLEISWLNNMTYLSTENQIWEEDIAIDLQCPLVVHPTTITKHFYNLARLIVKINAEKKFYGMVDMSISRKLLNVLKCGRLYPEMEAYVMNLTERCLINEDELSKEEKIEKYRFYKPSEEFRKKFDIDEEIIYFKNHKQVDKFYKVLKRRKNFHLKYTGLYYLLKGLDDAFWMQGLETENCPFRK